MSSIGQRICELRKERSYSQEYVAEKLGVSRQAVSKWETDASAPDTYNLIALSELFGVTVEYIAIGKQQDSPQAPPTATLGRREISYLKILGIALISIGLLLLVLGILLSEIITLLSLYILVGGILLVSSPKRLWFAAMWTFFALTFILFRGITGSFFCIFHPSIYQDGRITYWMAISYVFWIWLIVAVSVTVAGIIKKRKNK